jgi:hypothetical protein
LNFFNKNFYSIDETDEIMIDLRKEISNFITKEEAELLISRRKAMVDPSFSCNCQNQLNTMMHEIESLNKKIYYLSDQLDKAQSHTMKYEEQDEPII